MRPVVYWQCRQFGHEQREAKERLPQHARCRLIIIVTVHEIRKRRMVLPALQAALYYVTQMSQNNRVLTNGGAV